MKYLKPNDFFKSSDLALCATANYFGYPIEAIDRTNKTKVEFVIKRDKNLDQLIQDFWTHKLSVEPANFFSAIRELKNRIYQ